MLLLHRFPRLTIALTLLVAVVYCSGGEDIVVPPPPGTLQIQTSTDGAEPDADGYSVQIDGGSSQAIGAVATLSIPEVPPGNHTVELADIAGNCTISSSNPQGIRVTAGETATVSFAVTCGATTGGLSITAATSGPSPDPDGYAISIDGADRGALGVNAAVTISGLVPGSHARRAEWRGRQLPGPGRQHPDCHHNCRNGRERSLHHQLRDASSRGGQPPDHHLDERTRCRC